MHGSADPLVGNTQHFRSRVSSIEQRKMVAQRTGIDRCIKYDTRPGGQSSSVLGKAVNAIVGATFVDSGADIMAACKVMLHLGLVPPASIVSHHELIGLAFSKNFEPRRARYQPRHAVA
jgi:hypothetical protein